MSKNLILFMNYGMSDPEESALSDIFTASPAAQIQDTPDLSPYYSEV